MSLRDALNNAKSGARSAPSAPVYKRGDVVELDSSNAVRELCADYLQHKREVNGLLNSHTMVLLLKTPKEQDEFHADVSYWHTKWKEYKDS